MTDPTRRIELTLTRPWFALSFGVRPTVTVEGRGNPVQWGVGTWQLPADRTATIGVFLFNRLWRYGQSEIVLAPDGPSAITYRAPALPFGRGRMRATAQRGTGA